MSLGNVAQSLMNPDHRVLFGRRGTGKTHVLAFVASSVRANGDAAIILDLRNVGSNSYIYADEALSIGERSTRLLRDFIEGICSALLDEVTRPTSNFSLEEVYAAIETLGATAKEVLVTEKFEEKSGSSSTVSEEGAAQGSAKVSLTGLSGAASASIKGAETTGATSQITRSGSARISINMGSASRAMAQVASSFGVRLWVLIDEWSTIPESLQPYLADFLKRVMFPVNSISVTIVAIEQRSSFRKDGEHLPIGIELGSDAFADINLDDYLVFENNPKASAEFFRELIFRHLVAMYPKTTLPIQSAKQLQEQAFTQEAAFVELVRASEGVPRDFINILQIAATKAGEHKISVPTVRNAAKDWYDRDKAAFIDSNQAGRNLLHWVVDVVIGARKARAFLVRTDVRDVTLDRLFDERILHIAKRSYSAKEEPGVRYKVWKIDYGCYADFINTSKAPTGFLFEGEDIEQDSYIPEDDLRAVRRAVLNLQDFYEANTPTLT